MSPTEAPGGRGRRLVFATRNEGKVRELLALLERSAWTVERLPETIAEFEEAGETFADNARGKALFATTALTVPVLADDSGLEVDALGGEPGVRSARYLDEGLSQAERNEAILAKLRGTPGDRRSARFVCHLVLAYRGRIVHETTGVCEGMIAEEPRGEQGFGYDPIFLVPEIGQTFAEIDQDEKSLRSHRGIAVRAMADFLRSWAPD